MQYMLHYYIGCQNALCGWESGGAATAPLRARGAVRCICRITHYAGCRNALYDTLYRMLQSIYHHKYVFIIIQ